MIKSKLNMKLLVGIFMALALSACKSTPIAEKPVSVEDKRPATASSDKSSTSEDSSADTSTVSTESISVNPLTDPNNILSKRSIYFDFDKDTIKDEYRNLIDAHSKYLSDNNTAKVILQGNADERGTREYNLSLGQRRAVAVKKAFNLLNVQDEQIETVSFGEEKVTQNCKDEECHQQNRRVDIVYEGE